LLAICSLFAGWLGWPHSLEIGPFRAVPRTCLRREAQVFTEEGRAGQLAAGAKEEEHTSPTEYLLMFLSVAAAGVGFYMAGRAYGKADKGYTEPIATAAPPVYNTLLNKYYVDEGYDLVFTGRRKSGDVRSRRVGCGRSVGMA